METLILLLAGLFCLIGLLLSSLAFSGTWLVLTAALLTRFTAEFPGTGTLVVFALLCFAVEVFEFLAGFFGVQQRGGSRLAGLAALIGGLAGAVSGTAVFPILGTLAGMLLGSFAAAFLVEWLRLRHKGQAAHIAWGTVWARLTVLFMKIVLTLGMSLWLLFGLLH